MYSKFVLKKKILVEVVWPVSTHCMTFTSLFCKPDEGCIAV